MTSVIAAAQGGYVPQGSESPITAPLLGDQLRPAISVRALGGFLVWHDNFVDGTGLGIGAVQLNRNFSAGHGAFRINETVAGDQENPRVAMLRDGGAIVVWQGGAQGFQDIYGRILAADGTFASGDLLLNSHRGTGKSNPDVTVLDDGSVVVVWASLDQDGSMKGIFGQRLAPDGSKLGGEFQCNTTALYNQRDPAVAALGSGGFAVGWISEQQSEERSLDFIAKVFDAAGNEVTGEILVDDSADLCANPALSRRDAGGFIAAWSQYALGGTSRWDAFAREFDAGGVAEGSAVQINRYTQDAQFAPRLAPVEGGHVAVWTTVGQDGSREGVAGRYLGEGGQFAAEEIHVNTTLVGSQLYPAIASDGAGRFVVVWSGFMGGAASYDLFIQRYSQAPSLPKPAPPMVSALSQSRLSVAWPEFSGVNGYELYIDDSPTPVSLTVNFHTIDGLPPNSSHSVRLKYRGADGASSPASDPAEGRTWSSDDNFDGIPDDWQRQFWGDNRSEWAKAGGDSDGDGATNVQEFLAGTSPVDPESVLRIRLVQTEQSLMLEWNTQAGSVYQVQSSDEIDEWSNFGPPRFAAGSSDSVLVPYGASASYYRIIRQR